MNRSGPTPEPTSKGTTHDHTSADLAKKQTVVELVAEYEHTCRDVRAAFSILAMATDRVNAAFTMKDFGGIRIRPHGAHYGCDWTDPEETLLDMRHDCWRAVIDRMGMRRILSVSRAKQLDEDLDKKRMPELTVEAVLDLMHSYVTQHRELLAESVEEVFDWLRPRGHTRVGQLKTNSELEVRRKVILGGMVGRGFGRSGWRVRFGWADERLTALENVFTALEGKGQITKTHYSAVSTVISTEGFTGAGETPYFRFKCFGNGNLHLEFKREDLLAEFNRIAGGRRLRPATTEVAS